MASLNKVLLIGNLTRDPDLRYTPSGTAVANLRLAVNRTFVVQGDKREETLFIDVVAWGKSLERRAQRFVQEVRNNRHQAWAPGHLSGDLAGARQRHVA